MTGTIPTQLANLSSLTMLHLGGNQLSGSIPPELGNLPSLEWLGLSRNQLTAEIPSELGTLSKLRALSIYRNQLSGSVPSELGGLTSLSWLSLRNNQLSGEIPHSLTGLALVEYLGFYSNAGLCAPIDNTFQTWLQDVDTVQGSSCAPQDSQGDRVVLSRIYNASDGVNWRNSSNWLSNRPVREWYGVTNDANGRITGLFLAGNQLSGSIPTEMGDLSNLEWLRFHVNQLTGPIPSELGNLSNLRVLFLNQNQLTGSIPPELGNLSSLERLYLSDNQLTGCIPASIQDVFLFTDLDQLGLPICGIPTVTMSVDSATYQVRIHSPIPVTATFSEPVDDFTESDVTVANGAVSNFSGSNGDSVYTFDVTPNAIGVVNADIAAGVAESYEGNGNTAAVQLTLGLPYDDDHDGAISRDEVITAISDYLFGSILTRDEVVQIIGLYLFG